LCAQALGYAVPQAMHYGLAVGSGRAGAPGNEIALLHGTSRADKLWPDAHWLELGRRLLHRGASLALVHGTPDEERRSHLLAQQWAREGGSRVRVWPRMALDGVIDQLARCRGAIGVDTGLSHLAVALDLPHVQIYRHPTAWRTGPLHSTRQLSVEDVNIPSVDQVWDAWCSASGENSRAAPLQQGSR
jgi:heptosyltransferase-1